MNLEEWRNNRSPTIQLTWQRRTYVSKSIEKFPCKIWIKSLDDKDTKLAYYIIEDNEYLELFLSNASDKLRYAVEYLADESLR